MGQCVTREFDELAGGRDPVAVRLGTVHFATEPADRGESVPHKGTGRPVVLLAEQRIDTGLEVGLRQPGTHGVFGDASSSSGPADRLSATVSASDVIAGIGIVRGHR